MSPFSRERVYVYTPEILIESVRIAMERRNQENPLLALNSDITHDFTAWGLKKAFNELTGFHVDSFVDHPTCTGLYQHFRRDFEHYMFGVIQDIGARQLTGDLRYNLVLTYDRLYIFAF